MKIRHTVIPDVEEFKQYYLRGQQGGSITGFRGARIQKGYGIGNFFKSIARFAIPLVKRRAQAIGNRALGVAIDVGHDILAGKNVKQAMKGRSIEAVEDIAQQGAKQLRNQSGGGRKRKAPIKESATKKSISRSQTKKRKTTPASDISFSRHR